MALWEASPNYFHCNYLLHLVGITTCLNANVANFFANVLAKVLYADDENIAKASQRNRLNWTPVQVLNFPVLVFELDLCFHKYFFFLHVTQKALFFERNPNTGPTRKTLHSVETLRWNWCCFVTATDSESPCQPVMSFLSQTGESHDRSNDAAFSFSTTQKLIGPPRGARRSEVICFELSLRELAD